MAGAAFCVTGRVLQITIVADVAFCFSGRGVAGQRIVADVAFCVTGMVLQITE